MASTRLETKSSSSERRFYIHVFYSLFHSYIHQYNSPAGGLLMLMHLKRNIPHLRVYMQLSSRRCTFGSETCRRYHKL